MTSTTRRKRKRKSRGRPLLFLVAVLLISAAVFVSISGNASKKSVEHTVKNTVGQSSGKMLLSVPYTSQNPDFPTGCEAVSAVMLLNYYGYGITAEGFVDNYLEQSSDFYTVEGQLCGPDPNKAYVGNPRTPSGYGCYEPVIESAIKNYTGSDESVLNTCGKSLEYLCKNYIDKGNPALVWASISMSETYPSDEWTLESGESFTWISGEHCLVLTGYDSERYYFNDPIAGEAIGYGKEITELRYEELGMQSLVIKR